MTTFAEYLVAASSLPSGTVWDLITHPRTGGPGIVVNNGATAVIADSPVAVSIRNTVIGAALVDTGCRVVIIRDAGVRVTLDVGPT